MVRAKPYRFLWRLPKTQHCQPRVQSLLDFWGRKGGQTKELRSEKVGGGTAFSRQPGHFEKQHFGGKAGTGWLSRVPAFPTAKLGLKHFQTFSPEEKAP